MAGIICITPVLLKASIAGSDVGYSGANGEQNCASCHSSGAQFGNVTITFPNGPFYNPGQTQTLVVTVTDSIMASWGFQLTARPASSPGTMAGNFTPGADGYTQTVCSDSATDTKNEQFGPSPCPSKYPLQWIDQTSIGAQVGRTKSASFQFTWTAPSSNVGSIVMNIAAVASDGSDSTGGSHVYTATYTLTVPVSNQPQITTNGVVNGAGYQTTIAPGGWITIYGTNLANSMRGWGSSDIVNGQLPTQLDGVSVNVGGKTAYVEYVSPTQVNALAPNEAPLGNGVGVIVNNNGLVSNPGNILSQSSAPAFFLWASKYAVATHAKDFTYAIKDGVFPGTTTVPAKPGETIILWATGLGPTTPVLPSGRLTPSATSGLYMTTFPLTVTIGGIASHVNPAVLAPGFAGLYQIGVTVPDSLADGDQPISVSTIGTLSPSGVFLTVQR
jgi:uncharacterized protein (TIGR03437 family)